MTYVISVFSSIRLSEIRLYCPSKKAVSETVVEFLNQELFYGEATRVRLIERHGTKVRAYVEAPHVDFDYEDYFDFEVEAIQTDQVHGSIHPTRTLKPSDARVMALAEHFQAGVAFRPTPHFV